VPDFKVREEGAKPGEQYGKCLFGSAADLSFAASSVSPAARGGGVRECDRSWCCWTTSVAMLNGRQMILPVEWFG
jgi:hypothetical protein